MATEDVKDGVLPASAQQQRTKRKRWGERPTSTTTPQQPTSVPPPSSSILTNQTQQQGQASDSMKTTILDDPKAKVLAMQESIRARLAAAKAAQQHQQHNVIQQTLLGSNMTTAAASGLLKRPLPVADILLGQTQQPTVKKAKVYELDLSVTAPTFHDNSDQSGMITTASTIPNKTAATKAASAPVEHVIPSNPYLLHQNNNVGNEEMDDTMIDPRLLRTGKVRKRHKEFNFIEPGKYQEIAITKREKEMKAIASGYMSGRKVGHTITAPTLASLDSNVGPDVSLVEAISDDDVLTSRPEYDDTVTTMPIAMEWWDIELLPSKLKKEVAAAESKILMEQATKKTKKLISDTNNKNNTTDDPMDVVDDELTLLRQRCYEQASYTHSKTSTLVQHIVPIQPTNLVQAEKNQKPLVLHLTKKELKRQRKLRRQVQQQEKQDLQAAGLLPAPEPRLTLRNFIQVLGDQAYLDPSQIEQKVQEQMLARQRAHIQRNEAAKLTKEQRSEKIARKLKEDTTVAVTTALFYVKDMSHPYHRAKVDLNAQQFNLSGCVVECSQEPSFACVIVEGGPKAIKRYTRLMLVRMKWTGPDNAFDDEDDMEMDMNDQNDIDINNVVAHKFNPNNTCQLIWQGLSVKRLFHGFIFQACATHDQGRKIFKVKGAAHYWDQVLQFATSLVSGQSSTLQIKLLSDDDNDDDDNNEHVE